MNHPASPDGQLGGSPFDSSKNGRRGQQIETAASIPLADDDDEAASDLACGQLLSSDQRAAATSSCKKNGCESTADSIPCLVSEEPLPLTTANDDVIGQTASRVSEQLSRLCTVADDDCDASLSDADDAEDKAKLIAQVTLTTSTY